jgi:hypothetical protein
MKKFTFGLICILLSLSIAVAQNKKSASLDFHGKELT